LIRSTPAKHPTGFPKPEQLSENPNHIQKYGQADWDFSFPQAAKPRKIKWQQNCANRECDLPQFL
jgi:hypothetical protein